MFATVSKIAPVAPFSFRWPEETEEFGQGWDFTAAVGSLSLTLRHGLGRRVVFGRSRVHSVTWIGKHPTVEGNAADDYLTSRCLISQLKRRGEMRLIRLASDVPPVYNDFQVVKYHKEMVAPRVPDSLVLKIKEDDLVAWATHALWRAHPEAFAHEIPLVPAAAARGTNRDIILALIRASPGLTDAEIRERTGISPVQQVNSVCLGLERYGSIQRVRGPYGKVINVPVTDTASRSPKPHAATDIATTVTSSTSQNEVIGSWRLLQQLGQGAFGVVWLAEHVAAPGMLRALKFVLNPEMADSVRREADRLVRIEKAAIDYRHIARLMDILSLDPPCLVYEFVAGENLAAFAYRLGLPLAADLAGNLLSQLLSGLTEVHLAGLVHRDLHPGNIMLTAHPLGTLVKILDFGLAYPQAHAHDPARVLSGLSLQPSHPWAEPAYQRGMALPDVRTDLYSVGALLWWILTGQQGLPAGRVLRAETPAVPAELLAIVQRACIDARQTRFADAPEMRQALQRAVANYEPHFK